jgi:hypothetical protein
LQATPQCRLPHSKQCPVTGLNTATAKQRITSCSRHTYNPAGTATVAGSY